ncbi:MAG: CopG family transcriptional regulator [Gammaproteobacteria bacterium]
MGTTTIRIEKTLRARVRSAARRAGKSPHNFIVDAIEEQTRQAEVQQQFRDDATRRLLAIGKTGRTIPWKEMRAYLEKRLHGGASGRPKPRKRAGA